MWKPRDHKYAPPDDAPLFELIGYWLCDPNDISIERPMMPTHKARQRLLAACVEEPKYFARLFGYLPDSDEACEAVKALLDKPAEDGGLEDDAREKAHYWLMFRSRYFRAELIAAADKKGPGAREWPNTELMALARLDWKTAEPMLTRRGEGNDAMAAGALGILYRHAIAVADRPAEAALRERLKEIVASVKLAARARQVAVDRLLESEWEGKTDWAASLLADPVFTAVPTSRQPERRITFPAEAHYAFEEMIRHDPNRFVPLLAKIAQGPRGEARNAAVGQLIEFRRTDAMRALLPWLADPAWATVTRAFSPINGPQEILEKLGAVDVPESVPILSKMAETSEGGELRAVAMALVHQHAENASAVVRKALDAMDRPDHVDWEGDRRSPQGRLVQAAIDRGLLADQQIVKCIAACALYNQDSGGGGGLFSDPPARPKTHDATIGQALIEIPPSRPGIASALLDRWESWRRTDPPAAQLLWKIVTAWPDKAVDKRILRCLDEQPLDPLIVTTAIKRSASMSKLFPKELRELIHRGGEHAGLAAMLLGDRAVSQVMLEGTDHKAARMLLASARLGRASLPVPAAGRLLKSGDAKIAHAAERYLSCEESVEARNLIWSQHPGDIAVLGARWFDFPGEPTDFDSENPETPLRNEMKGKDAPEEMFMVSATGGVPGSLEETIVRRHGKAASLEFRPWGAAGKSLVRELTAAELRELLDFVANEHMDDLPQVVAGGVDGMFRYYLHLTPAGGRRVGMYNAGAYGTAGSPHYRIVLLFRHLADTGRFQTHYYALEAAIPGLRVLYTNRGRPIGGIWRQADQLFVGLGDREEPKVWHVFRNGKITGKAAKPAGFVSTDRLPWGECAGEHFADSNDQDWRAEFADYLIFAINNDDAKLGLFRWRKSDGTQRITDMKVSGPVTTYDGRWAVAAMGRGLVSVELSSGKVRPIKLPDDRQFTAEVFIPILDKVLAFGTKQAGDSMVTENWLVDPATATAELAKGDFRPVLQTRGRLQPSTAHPDELWLTLTDENPAEVKKTTIGRYNVRTHAWTRVFTLPGLHITNDRLAINEAAGMIEIAANGDLLQLPLPAPRGAKPAPAAPAGPLLLRVEGDGWGASKEDIEKVISSAAEQIFPLFPGRTLKPIIVTRGRIVPITLDQKGPAGEWQVKLATGGTFWAQYTYQFAHELCHVLSNCDQHRRGKQQWFDETLCETSSLFVLSKMHKAWSDHPPYSNWKDWGVHFDEYLNALLAERARRLPPDQTMGQWIKAVLPELVNEHQVTSHSKLVATYLLPIFQDEPEGWEALNWYGTAGEKDQELDFELYLRSWKTRVPEKHKAFVGKIQKLFGYAELSE
jgi:hypothetical protein